MQIRVEDQNVDARLYVDGDGETVLATAPGLLSRRARLALALIFDPEATQHGDLVLAE